MSVPDDNALLLDVLGPPSYNNFGEPIPPSNRPSVLLGLVITFLALSWIFVSFRLYVRLRVLRMPGWDDLFVFLYLIFNTITSIAFLVSIKYGTGQHYLLLTVGEFKKYIVLFYVYIGCLTEALAFIKLSLLFQYLRIFEKGTWTYRASVFGIVFVTLWCIAFSILAWFPCARVSDAWNVFSPDRGQCWATESPNPTDFTASLVTYTVINLMLDLFITILPFQLFFRPDSTMRTRAGLLALLVLGGFVNFFSIWRLQSTIVHDGANYPTKDPTWYGPLSILLSVLEVNVASICASVPVFWPMLRPYLGFIFVTREVSVKHEYRDDVITLRASQLGGAQTCSEAELNASYNDAYMMDWISPFRAGAGSSGLMESRVSVGENNAGKPCGLAETPMSDETGFYEKDLEIQAVVL